MAEYLCKAGLEFIYGVSSKRLKVEFSTDQKLLNNQVVQGKLWECKVGS